MSYPDRFLADNESVVRQFRPHWRMLVIPVFWVMAGIVLIVLTLNLPPDGGLADPITIAAVIAALLPLAVWPVVRWWFTSYILTTDRLATRSGVIARSGIEIPLENINNVIFHQNILERLLRSGDLLIESAGETGQSRFSDIPDPEDFQSLLYRVREQRTRTLSGSSETAAANPAGGSDPIDRLERLAALRDRGLITDEEFESKRRKLVDEL